MPYVVENMEAGEWSLGLLPDTPRSVLTGSGLIEEYAFATLVLTPVEVNEADFTDAQMLAQACYTGRYRGQKDGRLTLAGDGLVGWLGDENDDGDMYAGADGTTSDLDLEAQLDARIFTSFANGLTKGDVNQSSTARTLKFSAPTTRRQFLDTICALYPGGPYEWRCNPDGSVDVDRQGILYPSTSAPTVIVVRDGGSGSVAGAEKWLALDGTGDFASAPDDARLDITGDLTLIARVRLDDYTAAAEQVLVSKWNATGNQRSYRLGITSGGEISLTWSTNGTATATETSTGASFSNGSTYWIAVSIDVDDGGGNRVTRFYQRDNTLVPVHDFRDVGWVLVDTNTTAGTTSIFNSTAVARVGGIVGDTLMPTGRVYAVAITDDLLGTTTAADPDFNGWSVGQTSKADEAGNTWTLSGNAYIASEAGATVTGLPADLTLAGVDVEDYRTNITAGDPNTAIVGTATNVPPSGWVDFAGDGMVLRSLIHSTPRANFQDHPRRWSARVGANKYAAWVLNSATQATRVATRAAESVNTYAITVTADVEAKHPTRYFQAGDSVWVWDHPLGLLDNANEVYYRGEPAHPVKLRVQRMEVPITDGMGVYLRTWDGSAFDYINLTRHVDFEEGPIQVDLGTKARFRPSATRPGRLNRRRMKRQARQHYKLARYLGTSP